MHPPRRAYEVVEYTIKNLDKLLAEAGRTSTEAVRNKLHRIYFEGYLAELGTRTIVAEFDYVDRDYLVDFATYYVRCFRAYDRWCTRLHFFDKAFTEDSLARYLEGAESDVTVESLRDGYLGFVVVKPLPVTLIGRTCLRSYDRDGGRRAYPATRPYEVNFFGTELAIDSLAFQEQDTVVAACATSALWSALHGTSRLFQHQLPTPSEITSAATTLEPLETRQFPNSGLNGSQMARAIRSVGLEPYLVGARDPHVLRATAHAYLRMGIPVVLGLALFDRSDGDCGVGLHAITLTGFSIGKPNPTASSTGDLLLEASRIDKFYAHDDQVGPFSRVLVGDQVCRARVGPSEHAGCELGLSWPGSDGQLGSVAGIARFLLVPVYHKVRISYSVVEDAIARFDAVLHVLRTQVAPTDRLVWDIRLTTAADFKRDVPTLPIQEPSHRRQLLTSNLPRFLWRATGKDKDAVLIDLLFDATDLEQGDMLVEFEVYDSMLLSILTLAAGLPPIHDALYSRPWSRALARRLTAVTPS